MLLTETMSAEMSHSHYDRRLVINLPSSCECETVSVQNSLPARQGSTADGLRLTGSEAIPLVNVFQPTVTLHSHTARHTCVKSSHMVT